ncbi:hypothetical protein KP13_03566 [Klebsiella pneumoniae subsp. pneumoniae Kp13]|nr:hypothetical protein KP13_03566 [Klebsiella pneumoniae subsp. pneumoniae Kp13]
MVQHRGLTPHRSCSVAILFSFPPCGLVWRHYKQATTDDENGEMMEIHHCAGGIFSISGNPEK